MGTKALRILRPASAAALTALLLAAPAVAAPRPGKKIERPVRSASPDAGIVAESFVRLYKPLPEAAGPHPKRCDWISYLRFRNADGPRKASRADAIFVSMPGIFAGAAMHDQLARNVVRRAARHKQMVEYWALDRRSNCLEDHSGVRAAARARDAKVAFDYYWGEAKVHGHRFGGFKTPEQAAFLSEVGLEQTLRDEYAVIRRGVPNRRLRRRKVFCGGHSLGGPLTTAFAGWDFDGDPKTKRDAGYMQCAGFFGLDTSLGFDSSGGSGGDLGPATALAQASSGSPYLNVPPFTPETIELIGPFGVDAYYHPQGTNLIGEIPHSRDIDFSQRFLFSRDLANFITGSPSIRDFRTTNELVLAGIFDDNSSPVTILRTSLGTVKGGPVVQKDFPLPGSAPFTAQLIDNRLLMIPSAPHGPLYSWWNYDRMNRPGTPRQVNDAGERFTSAQSEFADVHQFAREMFEAPADWAEQYFPTRLTTDIESAQSGDRSGSLENLRYDGISKRPAFLIQAGDSEANSGANPKRGSEDKAPSSKPQSGVVTLPGYNHIDVVNAAWRQLGGRPERSSQTLVGFALRVLAHQRRPH
jgi:hypothetical protein